jgi:hypothetical protein
MFRRHRNYKKNKNNSLTCQFKKFDPYHCMCDPNTTANKFTCISCDRETLYTDMHLSFHVVFIIYVGHHKIGIA